MTCTTYQGMHQHSVSGGKQCRSVYVQLDVSQQEQCRHINLQLASDEQKS